MGHEFTSLVLALLQTGGHPPKVEQAVIDQIKSLPGSFNFETYISLCPPNCPDVVQALNLMAVLNPNVTSTMIDGAMFQDEVNARQIMAVPTTYLNGAEFGAGRMLIEEILAKVDTGAAARAAEELGQKEPSTCSSSVAAAGAAAAIYAARKGHPHRRRRRAFRRAGHGHPGHRELHLRAVHRRPSWSPRWNNTSRNTPSM